jgi:ABC-2 type transport system ATP-binding protein
LTAEPVIRVDHLAKHYGDLKAVDSISFEVRRGEIFAFLGPNGAGKTTTIEMLQCLRKPTSGKAEVLGLDIAESRGQREIRKRIGVLPQNFNSLEKLTVKENISLFAALYPESKHPDDLIRLLDLDDQADRRFDDLSGGLKQRVGIAAALVNEPEIIFLDEPTTGLDPKSRRDVWQVIRQLKEAGTTVFLTTHYMEEAQKLADRIAVIHRGRIVAMGGTSELLDKHGGERTLIVESPSQEKKKMAMDACPRARDLQGDLSIPVNDLGDISRVIDILAQLGVQEGIQIRNPTIEDVFLNLIGAQITEQGELT